jgi:pilus assembly protein CpaF
MSDDFRLIMPYLRPLQPLLEDAEVSEIMVNPGCRVFLERDGRLEACPEIEITERALQAGIRNVARLLGKEIDEITPLLDARLPDGSRVAAVFPPVSVGGTTLNIRKFQHRVFTPEELVQRDMMTEDELLLLKAAVVSQQNILISGGTGSGKTTLLNALSTFIDNRERVLVIEDTAEVFIDKPNLVRLEARRGVGDTPAVTIRALLLQTLRHRPDRIILGEVRGSEAFDLLTLLNTGHLGSISTIHANNAWSALARLRTCIATANEGLPDRVIARNIATAINVVVHIERRGDGLRRVTDVLNVGRYNPETDEYTLEESEIYA